MKVAVYLNGLAPYDEALFRGVSDLGVEVHLFVASQFVDRPYWLAATSSHGPRFKKDLLSSHRIRFGSYQEQLTLNLPSILSKERYDAVIVPFGTLGGLLLVLMARLRGKISIAWCGVHRFHFTPIRIIGEPIVRLYALMCSHFIAYSNFSRQYLIREGADPKRITVLPPNGVDTSRFSPRVDAQELRTLLDIESDCRIVLFVGRLEKEKGTEYLVRAIKPIHEQGIRVRLLVVGSGPQLPYLKKLVSSFQLQKVVTFVGNVPSDLVNQYYALCDIHVAPSIVTRYFVEPYGLVYQEAMASGKPSIAFDIPAPLRYLIVNGETGYLVKEANVADLSNRILELLTNDKKREEMGRRARERALARFDMEKISATWADSLKNLMTRENL